ncbi:MAG: MG2 domain-containing protein, partial [Flavobacterium sp.]
MKNILFAFLLFSTVGFAQQIGKKWDKVVAFENEGKVRSANEIVARIYKKAVADKDEVQIIKCFFYQSKYIQILQENAQTKIINNLKTNINRVSIPSKAILNLVYAKCLNDYFTRNAYVITQRTNIVLHDDDFLTWTESNFNDQINKAMRQTLENEKLLKAVSLAKYEPVFDYTSEEKFKNEALFNYILKENITFYTQKIRSWEIDKSIFIPFKKDFFEKSANFTKLNLDFVSSESLRFVLSLYQKQEINSLTTENQFDRIKFCKTILFDDDDDYKKALDSLQKSTEDEILIQKIQLEKAMFFIVKASKEQYPDYNINASVTLDSIIKINNRSNACKSALIKRQNLLSKSITIQLQKYVYNNENTRAYIEYKNVERLKVSFYKINQKQLAFFNKFNNARDSLVTQIIKNTQPVATESYQLKNKKDYYKYTTEVLLPNLKTGSYLVYFESETDAKNKKAFAYEMITTSNLMAMATQDSSKETYQVLDRKTGKPIANATIKTTRFSIKTDTNGLASNPKSTNFNYEPVELSFGNDTITITKNYLQYNTDYTENITNRSKGKVEFYLDRAIYRPGQTVYYKGIAIQKSNNKTNVVSKTTFKIIIEDPDDNELTSFDATTNEFGSFSGEFALPKNILTGDFKIMADEPDQYKADAVYDKEKEEHPFWDIIDLENSETDFRVEEYKRPKFEVTLEPKKQTF